MNFDKPDLKEWKRGEEEEEEERESTNLEDVEFTNLMHGLWD